MSQKSSSASQKSVMDVSAFFLNISSSVFIVFVNKILMGKAGYAFTFATTLCAFHFLSCWMSINAAQSLGWAKKVSIPLNDALMFSVLADLSIASLNMSLMVNSVGFYQIAKLLIIPFVALVEFFFYGKTFSSQMLTAMVITVSGVAIVTVSDVQVNTLGLVIAGISVVSSGMQQLECGRLQRKHGVQSNELLSNTAPIQGVTLLIVGPFIDKLVTTKWIVSYDYSVPAVLCLLVTCAIAVAVNISQFMCLGRFSASTFQVLGHSKTLLVLLGSWLLLGETIKYRQLMGMTLAVCGMIAYGVAASNAKAKAQGDIKNKEQSDTSSSSSASQLTSFLNTNNNSHSQKV
eukprot:TRINITY_DN4976_c0_g3_i2.p1 TRINITY_DN4976_c0_g3~~TRINITY_DN4976_c0_g3_i2.p1  ORF type:complete len:347 (-),score=38.71 TRINITY_DN4976_c0_g3_i2:113-1153(-)